MKHTVYLVTVRKWSYGTDNSYNDIGYYYGCTSDILKKRLKQLVFDGNENFKKLYKGDRLWSDREGVPDGATEIQFGTVGYYRACIEPVACFKSLDQGLALENKLIEINKATNGDKCWNIKSRKIPILEVV